MRVDQGRIEVDDERPGHSHRAEPRTPRPRSGLSPCRPDGSESIGIDRIDDATRRWGGGHGAEETGLITQHGQIGQAVAAIGQGKRHIEQDAAGIMTSAPPHRRSKSSTQRCSQASEIGHLSQQPGAGMGSNSLAIGSH
jgi:hypothetical protein